MGKPKTLSKRAKKLLAKKKGFKVRRAHEGDEAPPSDNETAGDPESAGSSSRGGTAAAQPGIDDILDRAVLLMETYEYDAAKAFCQRALQMDNDNARALETTANLLLEVGDGDGAKRCLGRAITVAPESGHGKYLSLAQLLEGREALGLYEKGMQLIRTRLQDGGLEEPDPAAVGPERLKLQGLRRELSNCHCAVAELYMTDLCDEAEAEAECGANVDAAVAVDPDNPEAWQTKARLHMVKTEFEDAKEAMRNSTSLWLPAYLTMLGEGRRSSVDDPVEVCPLLYTTRINTAKILIELEEWDTATQVLDGLTEEDEDVVDTWYLLGLLNKLRADLEGAEEAAAASEAAVKVENEGSRAVSDGYRGNARYYLNKAAKVQAKHPTDDLQLVEHVEELLEELGPSGGNDEDDSEDGGDWEDVVESSEDEDPSGPQPMEDGR